MARAGFTNYFFNAALVAICLVGFSACKHTPASDSKSAEASETELNAAEEDQAMAGTDVPKHEEPIIDENGNPHPKRPTEWATRKLLMLYDLPPGEKLKGCKQDAMAIADESRNQEDLIEARDQMQLLLDKDPVFYHWCFYTFMTLVDQKMEAPGSRLDDRARDFIDSMRALWIVGTALDDHYETDRYFNYLRARYVAMSRDYFGRSLEVFKEGLRSQGPSPIKKNKKLAKPAGPSPADE